MSNSTGSRMPGRAEPAPRAPRLIQQSEEKLQTKLGGSAPPGADDGIRSCPIRGSTAATERAWGRRIVVGIPVLPAEGIREVWMIENVEELSAKLDLEAFGDLPILDHREIPVAEARIAEEVAAHGTEATERRGNHDRASLRIAAKGCE